MTCNYYNGTFGLIPLGSLNPYSNGMTCNVKFKEG